MTTTLPDDKLDEIERLAERLMPPEAAATIRDLFARVRAAEAERYETRLQQKVWGDRWDRAVSRAEVAEARFRDEERIVNRVWQALEIEDYDGADGLDIAEIAANWKNRAETAEATIARIEFSDGDAEHWRGLAEKALARVTELERAIKLILPMAEGYALAHGVGNNAVFIAEAKAALTPKEKL